jgi:hypothetical protein
MDEKQIKKEIEKKIDKWGCITFWILFLLLIIIPFILNGIIPTTIGLYLIFLLGLMDLITFIVFSTYVYDFVEERYDDFIKREEYWQNLTLKEKILDILTLVWLMSPLLALSDIFIIPLYPIPGIISGIILVGFWLLGPFILGKDEKE